uniref:C2HC/C3H-type domain-containing protein n=1 Tax=Timema poppense TaxID=170557 RepID=A0A7R9D0N7_TIMPO|nr:unnamed protein product [Timema poppensis]
MEEEAASGGSGGARPRYDTPFQVVDQGVLGSDMAPLSRWWIRGCSAPIWHPFPAEGKVDYQGTMDAIWQSHLEQLVPCAACGRTFMPDRLPIHERSCKGPK